MRRHLEEKRNELRTRYLPSAIPQDVSMSVNEISLVPGGHVTNLSMNVCCHEGMHSHPANTRLLYFCRPKESV